MVMLILGIQRNERIYNVTCCSMYFRNVVATNMDFADETFVEDESVEVTEAMDEVDTDQTAVMTVVQTGETEAVAGSSSGASVNNFKPNRGSYKYRPHCNKMVRKNKENEESGFEKDLMGILRKVEDADDLFARSVAESLKKLSGKVKAQAKVKIQQLLLECEFPIAAPAMPPVPTTRPISASVPLQPIMYNTNLTALQSNTNYSCSGGENLIATRIATPTASMYEWGEGTC